MPAPAEDVDLIIDVKPKRAKREPTTFASFTSHLEAPLANALRVAMQITDIHAPIDEERLEVGLRTLLS